MKIKSLITKFSLAVLVALMGVSYANQPLPTLMDFEQNTPNVKTAIPLNAISPETLKTFVSVVDLVRRKYAYDVNDETLFRHAMSGMLTRLDNHAEFLDETAFKNLQAFTEGTIGTVGLVAGFDLAQKEWVVQEVLANSSADNANIEKGDYLYQIGDKKLDETLKDKDVAQLLAGVAGSQVSVVSSKAGRSKHKSTLQRTTPINDSLSITMHNGIALIKLPIFTDKTRQELNEALARQSTPISAIVIDVQDNPGGVLSSAISVASLFLDNENIIKISERGKPSEILKTIGYAPLVNMPVIIVQNRYSASAAEVLALALKKDQDAIVVGEQSYGKGSIQSIIPISQNEAVKLTTALYEGVDGQKIDGIGVVPDVVLDFKDDWLSKVLELAESKKLATGITVSLSSDY